MPPPPFLIGEVGKGWDLGQNGIFGRGADLGGKQVGMLGPWKDDRGPFFPA